MHHNSFTNPNKAQPTTFNGGNTINNLSYDNDNRTSTRASSFNGEKGAKR